MDHTIWVFLHVMLLVYWLGGDLGVFLLAKAAKRPDLSFAERAFALQMAVRIDLIPRLCFTLMFPVGLQLTSSGGFAVIPNWALVLAWFASAAWIVLLLAVGRAEGTPRAETLNRLHRVWQALLLVRRQAVDAVNAAVAARVDALRARSRLLVDARQLWSLDED